MKHYLSCMVVLEDVLWFGCACGVTTTDDASIYSHIKNNNP